VAVVMMMMTKKKKCRQGVDVDKEALRITIQRAEPSSIKAKVSSNVWRFRTENRTPSSLVSTFVAGNHYGRPQGHTSLIKQSDR
jgi:hypothetical protein